MLVIRAFNCANLASMVLGWSYISLVANLLLVTPFPFLAFPKTLAFTSIDVL